MQMYHNALNPSQRSAVDANNEPVLIIAGPGTGKTKTLTSRIAYLLAEKNVPADQIVALTFTNKAAREVRERLRQMMGEGVALPQVATFHALSLSLLRTRDELPPIIAESDRQAIIKALAKAPEGKCLNPRDLSLQLSLAKTSLAEPEPTLRVLLYQYNQRLQERGLCDFDDLLLQANALLREQVPQYKHVLVDEFQDTSELQYEILKRLAAHGTLFAIGDPNQSIYAFRGAGAAMFGRFMQDYARARQIALADNYRSRPHIVRLANAVFPASPQLIPNISGEGQVKIVQTLNEYTEAAYVLGEIEQGIGGSDLLKAGNADGTAQPRDYAVLYRTRRAAGALQRIFREAGIPHQIVGEGSPYARPDMQAVVAGLRYLYDATPPSVYKKYTATQLAALFDGMAYDEEKPVTEAAGQIADALGLGQYEHLRQFQSMLVQFGVGKHGLAAALRHIDEIRDSEFYDASLNAVSLMTVHAAKGLEFPHVFLIAAEEDILPKVGTADIEEERRLFYVAITRAKDTLEILHAKMRGGEPASLTRFIRELPAGVVECVVDPHLAQSERRFKKRAAKRAQTSLF